MNSLPASESYDGAEDDELPRDLVFLLTPAFDIYRRIEAGDFIAFVSNVSRAMDEQFKRVLSEGIELQVACALLPGRNKLVEFQVQPPGAHSAECEQLAAVIDQMVVPEVIEGPVGFFRRGVFGGGAIQEGGLGLPFLQFLRKPGMVLLDDVLLQAGGVPSSSPSRWRKLFGFFRADTRRVRTIAEQDIVPSLTKQLDLPVIVCNGRMRVGY